MAETLAAQALSAGTKIIKMVQDAKEAAIEAEEVALRAQSAIDYLVEGAGTFEDNDHLRKLLLELKRLFEEISDVLQLCIPQSKSLSKKAKQIVFSSSNRRALAEKSGNLERIRSAIAERMTMVIKEQGNRIENGVIAIAERGDARTKNNKVARRLAEGKVIAGELAEDGEQLGSGSFGVVVAGHYFGRSVAIKKAFHIVCSEEERENFRREAATHFALRHDRIVEVIAFSIGNSSHPPLLIMERMQGSLHDYLKVKRQSPDLPTWLQFIIDICEGIQYLHQSGVVHRDVKSPNILLHPGGAKVSDFGLAHVCSTIGRSTVTGGLGPKVGTNFWMAPEIHSWGKPSFDSDIFSLHVVMWEIIEGRQGGMTGREIGDVLTRDAGAKLPLEGEDGEDDPAKVRLNKLVRACGLLDRKSRPQIRAVLTEVKSIYDSLGVQGAGESSMASVDPPSGKARLSLSEAMRLDQQRASSENNESGWEQWKDVGLLRSGGDVQTNQVETVDKKPTEREVRAREAVLGLISSLHAAVLRVSDMHLDYGGDAARTAIMIYNATGSDMKFRLTQDIHGSVNVAFPNTIENGSWGLALHVKEPWTWYGSEGYVVYTVRNGAGQIRDVCLCFKTPFRGERAVYVEARRHSHWDPVEVVDLMTRLLNTSRGDREDLDHEGIIVTGKIAPNPVGMCQFIVGLQGLDIPLPWV